MKKCYIHELIHDYKLKIGDSILRYRYVSETTLYNYAKAGWIKSIGNPALTTKGYEENK